MSIMDTPLDLSDLTRNQITEMQIFAAYAVVGAVKKLIIDGDVDDPVLDACVARYETYADELRSRRGEDTSGMGLFDE